MELSKVNINDLSNELTNEEINELVEAFEDIISNYLEEKKEEILFYYIAMNLHINANDDKIIDTIFDIVCYNLQNELLKSFDASLVENNEIIDSMVMDFVDEYIINKNCFVDYIPNEIIEIWENE